MTIIRDESFSFMLFTYINCPCFWWLKFSFKLTDLCSTSFSDPLKLRFSIFKIFNFSWPIYLWWTQCQTSSQRSNLSIYDSCNISFSSSMVPPRFLQQCLRIFFRWFLSDNSQQFYWISIFAWLFALGGWALTERENFKFFKFNFVYYNLIRFCQL